MTTLQSKNGSTNGQTPHPATAISQPAAELTLQRIAELDEQFAGNPHAVLMQNAVCETDVAKIAINRKVFEDVQPTFSHVLDDWEVTSQMKSGRCWLFAGLNLLRAGAMKKMKLKTFEFSQSYCFFWDKFERSNYFLEQMIDMVDRDVDDRTVAYMLRDPIGDGGQWNMFVNVVMKYGLVPKSAMPESNSSGNSPAMNSMLKNLLREGARKLREAHANGAASEELRDIKQDVLTDIHRVLCINLGTPPKKFIWQWMDDDRGFHRDGEMDPHAFRDKYCTIDLEDYVCIVHDPRPSSPRGKTFTVDRLGNVIGADRVVYLNVEIDVMKDITRKLIEDGTPVWMGCDVGQSMDRVRGVWDPELFNYEGVYQIELTHDKAQRLLYHQTFMTHAMLFTGADIYEHDDGTKTVRRWRVENSWGSENGVKGFYTMNDAWYDQFMFEIACPKKLLPKELLDVLDDEPIILPAWDPMGALAR